MTTEVSPSEIQDEHYLMAWDALDPDVFLETVFQQDRQPAGWTRREGAGRVGGLTPGHNVAVWLHPEFQKLLRDGLPWLAKVN
jgi:uncharacterized protein